jgi:hypothetical protein
VVNSGLLLKVRDNLTRGTVETKCNQHDTLSWTLSAQSP